MKIVINRCYGGFGISTEAYDYMGVQYQITFGNSGFAYPVKGDQEDFRTNEKLIEFIEKYGSERASGECARLVIKDIPEGVRYRIIEYDGMEDIETESMLDWRVAT